MERTKRTCPICGCELSNEALRYRCWCCAKSYSQSEIALLVRMVHEQGEAAGDLSGRQYDERYPTL